MEKLNVAIADDNERIVEMLNALIRTENDMEIVGTAGNGEDAIDIRIERKALRMWFSLI